MAEETPQKLVTTNCASPRLLRQGHGVRSRKSCSTSALGGTGQESLWIPPSGPALAAGPPPLTTVSLAGSGCRAQGSGLGIKLTRWSPGSALDLGRCLGPAGPWFLCLYMGMSDCTYNRSGASRVGLSSSATGKGPGKVLGAQYPGCRSTRLTLCLALEAAWRSRAMGTALGHNAIWVSNFLIR